MAEISATTADKETNLVKAVVPELRLQVLWLLVLASLNVLVVLQIMQQIISCKHPAAREEKSMIKRDSMNHHPPIRILSVLDLHAILELILCLVTRPVQEEMDQVYRG